MENATPVGCYVLNKKIFTIPPVKIKSGEFGLPQTILEFSKENPVPTIEIKFWLPINSLSHLRQAEEILQKSNQHRFVVGDESSYTQEQ
jgi:NDP-sugar pyrophosphorylase family protein